MSSGEGGSDKRQYNGGGEIQSLCLFAAIFGVDKAESF